MIQLHHECQAGKRGGSVLGGYQLFAAERDFPQRELDIVSPYFVPGKTGTKNLSA